MAYRRFTRNYSKPTPRNLTVKYSAPCACCGAIIKAGSIATYYPAGTIASITEGKIAHMGGLEGNSAVCASNIKLRLVDVATNDYAGDGLDARYEDQCRDVCGL